MPIGTIEGIEKNKLSLILEVDGVEHQVYFPVTDVVDKWISEHPKQFHKGAVVDYILGKDSKTIVKITGPGGFKKAVPAHLEQKPIAPIVDAEKEQAKTRTVGMESLAHISNTGVPISSTAVNVKTVGSYDPSKIHGYEVSDTCQMVQFEPITIKVICDDPEEGRKALIAAWGVYGQHNEIVRDTVNKHIERSLMKRAD